MKKLFVFALVLALLAVPVVHAEDYASMTDDELWAANKAIQAELWARSIAKDGVLINPGSYLIGEDIPSGSYRVVLNKEIYACYLYLYKDEGKTEYDSFRLDEDALEIGKLNLDGYYCIDFDEPVTFFAYTGLFN